MLNISISFLGLTFLSIVYFASAQEEPEKQKDNSKSTDVYSQIDNFLDFSRYKTYNTFGCNPKVS